MFSVSLIFCACEKEEKLWELPPAGDESVASVNMGVDYDNAVFFNLKTGNSQTRDVYCWHLGFASGSTENHIVLNGGNEVQLYATNDTVFSKIYTTDKNTVWQWDNPNGDADSTAFTGWLDNTTLVSNNKVYLLDLGVRATSRYRKIKILSVSAADFKVRYANLDGSNERFITIPKTTTSNYTYLNLESNLTVAYEPTGFIWDIVFTKYRHVYYDMQPITPYYVTGALINTKNIQIAELDNIAFETIDYAKASQILLTSKMDEIGYDWKFYDLNGAGKYVVDGKKIYIIREKDGFLYKLKFISFYDNTGAKGVPEFVYKRL